MTVVVPKIINTDPFTGVWIKNDGKCSYYGNDGEKYALVCYSGKSYAEKATELMVGMGISEDQIYTVEGGITAWEEAGDEYTELLD